jgi:hypothetical protein
VTDAEQVKQEPDDNPHDDAQESDESRGDGKKRRWVGQAIADTLSGILGGLRP